MSMATVACRHSFGIKADVKDNICYLDEQTVIYPSGHNIVIFNTEQKTQKFIPGTENTEGITAMAVSPNHKYVAVAERAKEGEKAQVTIFDLHTLKRRKVRRRHGRRSAAQQPCMLLRRYHRRRGATSGFARTGGLVPRATRSQQHDPNAQTGS